MPVFELFYNSPANLEWVQNGVRHGLVEAKGSKVSSASVMNPT